RRSGRLDRHGRDRPGPAWTRRRLARAGENAACGTPRVARPGLPVYRAEPLSMVRAAGAVPGSGAGGTRSLPPVGNTQLAVLIGRPFTATRMECRSRSVRR